MRRVFGSVVLDGPTPDDFVGAVIRTHERIWSNLQALRRGAVSPAADSSADERTISVYCLHYGVEAGAPHGLRLDEHRWLAG